MEIAIDLQATHKYSDELCRLNPLWSIYNQHSSHQHSHQQHHATARERDKIALNEQTASTRIRSMNILVECGVIASFQSISVALCRPLSVHSETIWSPNWDEQAKSHQMIWVTLLSPFWYQSVCSVPWDIASKYHLKCDQFRLFMFYFLFWRNALYHLLVHWRLSSSCAYINCAYCGFQP